nr:hypothetical protein [uncultured Flavobacterium sp.]
MEQTKRIKKSNYFFIKCNKLGENLIVEFKDKNGSIWQYDHDLVYKLLQPHFDKMKCFIKKKEYVSTDSVPQYIQELDCVKIINRL